ncbi:unnamed protein product [Dicrocoelium dendriticum]|nr:unnamed protein product [Dicrocoelium dendriticum]
MDKFTKRPPSPLETTGQRNDQSESGKPLDPIEERSATLLDVSQTLWQKRKYFSEQMVTSCSRRDQLERDLKYLHERKVKCQSIIRDNDSKRWRALQKFCSDNYLCTVRKKEKQMLNAELRKAKQTFATLNARASDLRKYELYMLNVISSLPKDYIKLADDAVAGLMMRYNTLYETNTSLRREMEAKAEEVRVAQSDLKSLVEAHRILLFGKNSELSELYTHREKMNDLFQGAQQSLIHGHEELAQQLSNFKTVIRSINNITGKLVRAFEPNLNGMHLMARIQNMPLLSRCRLIEERTLAIRSIISQLANDTGTLPISICSRPDLVNVHSAAIPVASASEFTLLSKLTSAQSDAIQ